MATDGPDPAPWFVGDPGDPSALEIFQALPVGAVCLDCPGDLPETWPDGLASARSLVVHRPLLTNGDAARLRRLRVRGGLRIVLCVGAQSRYRDLGLWGALADAILPEATARETVARHLAGGSEMPRPAGPRPGVTVLGGHHDLRRMLIEVCQAGGYPVSASNDWDAAPSGGLVVWDAPVLEPDWADALEGRGSSKIIALMGFPDRGTVDLARSRGVSACLELPCDPVDLLTVLDRLTPANSPVVEPAHVVPPTPAIARRAVRKRNDSAVR